MSARSCDTRVTTIDTNNDKTKRISVAKDVNKKRRTTAKDVETKKRAVNKNRRTATKDFETNVANETKNTNKTSANDDKKKKKRMTANDKSTTGATVAQKIEDMGIVNDMGILKGIMLNVPVIGNANDCVPDMGGSDANKTCAIAIVTNKHTHMQY